MCGVKLSLNVFFSWLSVSVFTSLTTWQRWIRIKYFASVRAGPLMVKYFHSLNLKWKWEAIITVFNITIIPWWPFISHSLGTLVKAGLLKVAQAFVFLSVWKTDLSLLWPLVGVLLCAPFTMLVFPRFSAVSGCLTVQEQSPNLPCWHRRELLQASVISWGESQSEVSSTATEKQQTAVINVIPCCWEYKK